MNIKYIFIIFVMFTKISCWSASSEEMRAAETARRTQQDIERASGQGNYAGACQPANVAQTMEVDVFTAMPLEIHEYIAGFLNQESLEALAQVSRIFKTVSESVQFRTNYVLEQSTQLLNKHNGNAQAALFDAAENNKPWTIKYLLQNGADVNAIEKWRHNSALILAAQNGHNKIANLLIAARANINEGDRNCATALIKALRNGHEKTAKLLVQANADGNVRETFGMTALTLAYKFNFPETISLLIQHGAYVPEVDKWRLKAPMTEKQRFNEIEIEIELNSIEIELNRIEAELNEIISKYLSDSHDYFMISISIDKYRQKLKLQYEIQKNRSLLIELFNAFINRIVQHTCDTDKLELIPLLQHELEQGHEITTRPTGPAGLPKLTEAHNREIIQAAPSAPAKTSHEGCEQHNEDDSLSFESMESASQEDE